VVDPDGNVDELFEEQVVTAEATSRFLRVANGT
jgi:hypothetical protein